MLSWMPQLKNGSGPKYLAIAEALLADVQSGRLKPGHRLPPQRQLAKELGVDLTTVTRAFNEARRMGLIEANTGRGSYVRGKAPEQDNVAPAGSPIIDLSMNMPPQPPAAKLRERIQEGIAGVLSSPHGLMHLHYQESVGAGPDRTAAARWLGARLGSVPVDRVVVTGGAQTALYADRRGSGQGRAMPSACLISPTRACGRSPSSSRCGWSRWRWTEEGLIPPRSRRPAGASGRRRSTAFRPSTIRRP